MKVVETKRNRVNRAIGACTDTVKNYVFLLGGDDPEMKEIKKVALAAGCEVHDKNLQWGHTLASEYEKEVQPPSSEAYVCGMSHAKYVQDEYNSKVFVYVELDIDCDLPDSSIVINHHDELAGNPPSIMQVCSLLEVTPTRQQNLIGAADAGFVYGLASIGASHEEIIRFLGHEEINSSIGVALVDGLPEERRAESCQAFDAVDKSSVFGGLIVAQCPHSWTAPVCAMVYDRQIVQNLLILSADGEANYFGTGSVVRRVAKAIDSGWSGGAGLHTATTEAEAFWTQYGGKVPDTAFFGCKGVDFDKVLDAVTAAQEDE